MILEELELKLYEINKELPDINYGGCGTFSYHLKKVLEDKYNIKSEIYYLPGKPAAIEYDVLFSHIVVKVNDTIIDNNGLYECGSGWTTNLNKLSEEKLKSPNAADIMAASIGAVVGPYFADNTYKLAKVLDKKSVPDSVKASHILVAIGKQRSEPEAKIIIDSIEAAVKGGANFEQLAATRSEDQGSAQKGGDLGTFGQGQMVAEFNDACFNGNVGDLKVVKTQFGYHLLKVIAQSNFKPSVKLAIVSKALQAGEMTTQAVYAKATEFTTKLPFPLFAVIEIFPLDVVSVIPPEPDIILI